MAVVIAVHSIGWTPTDEREFTGRFDEDGNPVMKKKTGNVPPGAAFDVKDPVELAWLLSLGAVREPNEADADDAFALNELRSQSND